MSDREQPRIGSTPQRVAEMIRASRQAAVETSRGLTEAPLANRYSVQPLPRLQNPTAQGTLDVMLAVQRTNDTLSQAEIRPSEYWPPDPAPAPTDTTGEQKP